MVASEVALSEALKVAWRRLQRLTHLARALCQSDQSISHRVTPNECDIYVRFDKMNDGGGNEMKLNEKGNRIKIKLYEK